VQKFVSRKDAKAEKKERMKLIDSENSLKFFHLPVEGAKINDLHRNEIGGQGV
jgi:hypothetical protein